MAKREVECEILKCGICTQMLNEPKCLPCLHMFCESCIEKYISPDDKSQNEQEKFRCPVCHTIVPIPEHVSTSHFVTNLPTNDFIQALIDRLKIKSEGTVCGLCKEENHQKKATKWCEDCSEGLCDQCLKFHNKSKASKSHTNIIEIGNLDTQRPLIDIQNNCKEHSNMKLDLFCHDHEKACCLSCMATSHRKCDRVTTLKEASVDVKTSDELKKLLKKIDNAEEITEEILREKRDATKELEDDKQDVIIKIKSIRRDINTYLDELESKMLDDLNTLHEQVSKEMREYIEKSSESKTIVINCKRLLNTLLESSSESYLFLEKKRIRQTINDQDDVIESMTSDPTKTRYEVTFTQELLNILSSIQSFGTVKSVKRSILQYTTGKFHDIPNTTALSMTDCKAYTINTFETKECNTNKIHGIELLSDGRILLTNSQEKAVCLFESNGDLKKRISVPGEPVDVTMICEDTAAVSYWPPRGICTIDMNTMEIKQQNILKGNRIRVCGIISMDGNIIGICENKILVMDMSGLVMNESKTPEPHEKHRYITTVSNTRLCYTNRSSKSVICIDFDGRVVFTYKHEKLNFPYGITADNEGNIYVAGDNSSNVHQISPQGQLIQILLSEDNGICKPTAINLDRKNNKIVLTHSKSKITTFQMVKSHLKDP